MMEEDWRALAACAQEWPFDWFPCGDNSVAVRTNAERAKHVCQGCSVRDACLQDALDHEQPMRRHGIWGGMSAYEREIKFDGRRPRPKAAYPRTRVTHCKNGHEFTDENTHIRAIDGARICRACTRGRTNAYRAKERYEAIDHTDQH